ncbi:hypothetical protein QZH41_012612 [Actinostola sp. cb2023]|nr:hypothetical protein QZH41_012612 [Actinostola sp. cb2023]
MFGLPPVHTPLRADCFARELIAHPNPAQVSYVLNGIHNGFRIGFQRSRKLKPSKKNKESATTNPQVINSYLDNEVRLGRVAGPFSDPPLLNLHISSFGVIPKRGVQARGAAGTPISCLDTTRASGRPDWSLLEQQCQDFLQNGLAMSTRRTYASAQRRFVDFIKRSQGSLTYLPSCQRLPITDSLMRTIFRALDFNTFDHVMFWAACSLAYFGFLRSAEFIVPNLASFSPSIHLQVSDLAFDSVTEPSFLRVWIKASKTDPFRKGCHVHIGRGSPPLCAVSAVAAYLNRRGGAPGPLFLMEDGQPLSREQLSNWLRSIFATTGVDGNFSSHSFRIGAATVAANNGVLNHTIQALGRWTSNAYLAYIRTPAESLATVSQQLS